MANTGETDASRRMICDLHKDACIVPYSELAISSSVADVVTPYFAVADQVQNENPRVAYLCCYRAFRKVCKMDRNANGMFKSSMISRLEKEELETRPMLASSDPKEIQMFYQFFCNNNIANSHRKTQEEMAKIYQTATILYDVLTDAVLDAYVDEQARSFAMQVEDAIARSKFPNVEPLVKERPFRRLFRYISDSLEYFSTSGHNGQVKSEIAQKKRGKRTKEGAR